MVIDNIEAGCSVIYLPDGYEFVTKKYSTCSWSRGDFLLLLALSIAAFVDCSFQLCIMMWQVLKRADSKS
jgi:hypothetical protein